MARHAGLSYDLFPLTLALSLGEREPWPALLGYGDDFGLTGRLANVLPLPKGEGQGEGKGDARTTRCPGIGAKSQPSLAGLLGREAFMLRESPLLAPTATGGRDRNGGQESWSGR